MKRNWEYWLRWALLYPVAVIGSLLINTYILFFSNNRGNGGYDPLSRDYTFLPFEIIAPLMSAIAFVLIIYKMAPEFKKITVVISSILWILLICVFVLTDEWELKYSPNNDYGSMIPSILGILAASFFKLSK